MSASSSPLIAAVIAAAGSSTRMGAPKQLLMLHGQPVIVHTLLAFEQCPVIHEIVLTARTEDIPRLRLLAEQSGITKLKAIVPGGASRQESVAKGVGACGPEAAFFAIHDGARPLVTSALIVRVAEAAIQCGAAAAAVRVKDTIKVADAEGLVRYTPARSELWSVQTPQIFERELYLRALRNGRETGLEVTDDCQLVEAIHHPVRLVEGSESNLKLTTMTDMRLAEGWLT